MIYALLCLSPQILCTETRQKYQIAFYKTCYFFIWTFYYQKADTPMAVTKGNPRACRGNPAMHCFGTVPKSTASRTRSYAFLRHTGGEITTFTCSPTGSLRGANGDREDACSMIRHIPLGTTHLGRIAALNQLSREICSTNVR